jgi:hypothetical protein
MTTTAWKATQRRKAVAFIQMMIDSICTVCVVCVSWESYSVGSVIIHDTMSRENVHQGWEISFRDTLAWMTSKSTVNILIKGETESY